MSAKGRGELVALHFWNDDGTERVFTVTNGHIVGLPKARAPSRSMNDLIARSHGQQTAWDPVDSLFCSEFVSGGFNYDFEDADDLAFEPCT